MTITGVAPWAMNPIPSKAKGSGTNPPITITGVAPWAMAPTTTSPRDQGGARGSAEDGTGAEERSAADGSHEEMMSDTASSPSLQSQALSKLLAYMELCLPEAEGEQRTTSPCIGLVSLVVQCLISQCVFCLWSMCPLSVILSISSHQLQRRDPATRAGTSFRRRRHPPCSPRCASTIWFSVANSAPVPLE